MSHEKPTLIQLKAAEILNADSYFDDITVLTEEEGDLENAIAIKLGPLSKDNAAEKAGICLVVATPAARLIDAQIEALDAEIPVPVFVLENPIVNRGAGGSGKWALDVAVRVAKALQGKPHGQSLQGRFILDGIPFEELAVTKETQQRFRVRALISYMVNVRASAKL